MTLARRAWWWILDYAYAGRWQFRSAVSRIDPTRYRNGTGTPVLVIPGIYETWHFMRPLIRAVHAGGHPVHVVTLLQNNRLPVPKAAAIVADYIVAEDLHDVVILAHSKGGLIGKFAMLRRDTEGRIVSMVAICSPFSGSRYARYMMLPSLRSFRPTDSITLELARETAINERITSVFGLFDPHIPEGSVLPGATNIQVEVGGHFRIIADRRTADVVLAAVDRT